jgi:hypothetical protein
MKRKLLFVFVFVIAAFAIYTNLNQDSEGEKVREKYANFLKDHPYNKTLALTKKERKAQGIPPNKYFEQEYLLEMNPNTGRTHPENYLAVQKELNATRKLQRVPGDAADNAWVERGPNNIGGRTRVVMYDPNDATNKRVFAGGVSGGLWVNNDITNANTSWTRVGIDENLSINCMTVDPNNSQIMYVGTGESYTESQAIGNGVWKSTDGGSTWVNIYEDNFNTNLRARLFYINDIIAWNNPTTSKTEVFIGIAGAHAGNSQFPGAEKTGLYKTIDDGTSWTQVNLPAISGTSTEYEPNDIEIAANNDIWFGTGNNIYGKGGGTILKSTDGDNFTVEHTVTDGKRTELAVSKSNKDKIYILAQGATTAKPVMMYSTSDGFATAPTAVNLPDDGDTGIPANDFTRGQAFYDLVIEVDPTDDNKVYIGGIDLFRTTNSGATWAQISKWSNNNNLGALTIPTVHADQHGWAFHPTDANIAIIGNDGGVYYASSLSGAETTTTGISARIKDLNITQFYHGAIGPSTSTELLLSGAQDNGTPFVNGASAGINSATDIYGGDGAYSFIDKDGEYMIVAYTRNTKSRINLPYTGAGTELDSDQTTGSFINPGDLDDNLDILYSNGSDKDGAFHNLIRYSGIKSGQTLAKETLTNGLLNGKSTAFKVSPFTTTSTKLFVGTDTNRVLKIENANTATPTWTNIAGAGFPAGSISAIEFGATENEIMVTFHNYGVISIWFTIDGGTNWTSKEGDFPDIPVKAIIMNPLNNDEVIIGTQLGVWRTSNFKDASPKWSQSYNGMSNVKVTSFSLRAADNMVMASTFGRGMFTGQFATGVASVDDVANDSKVFTMYPTVSSGEFTVFAKNTLGKTKLQLFNINGKEVYSKQIDFTEQSKQQISVNLASGVYIVNLIDANNKKATSKVIIK